MPVISLKKFQIIFTLIAVVELLAEAMVQGGEQWRMVVYAVKPFLMPALALLYYSYSRHHMGRYDRFILIAFFFSWGGDIFLMLNQGGNKDLFVFGLASFLIAHLAYIVAFRTPIKGVLKRQSWLKTHPYLVIPVVIFAIGLVYLVYDNITAKGLAVPVIAYAAVISLMVLMAIDRKRITTRTSYSMVLIGAIVFLLSDSMIAINSFYKPFDMARVAIMATYILGQYFICIGALHHDHAKAIR